MSVVTVLLSYAYGDSTTNLIQPFFAIPILAVTRLRFGDVVLMFYVPDNDDPPAPKMTGELYCYPADIEECWDELREKVEVMSPLADWDHGMREFHIADCNGYVLRFGAPIEDAPD